MSTQGLLLLQHKETLEKLRAVAVHLKADPASRAQFVENPAGVLASLVSPGTMFAPEALGRTNRFVLALLSSKAFRDEFDAFVKESAPNIPSHGEIVAKFASLMVKHGDAALVGNSSFGVGGVEMMPLVAVEFVVVLVYAVAAVVAAVFVGAKAPGVDPIFSGKDALAISRQLEQHAQKLRKAGKLEG